MQLVLSRGNHVLLSVLLKVPQKEDEPAYQGKQYAEDYDAEPETEQVTGETEKIGN
jgi:hypothetical protein